MNDLTSQQEDYMIESGMEDLRNCEVENEFE